MLFNVIKMATSNSKGAIKAAMERGKKMQIGAQVNHVSKILTVRLLVERQQHVGPHTATISITSVADLF